MHLTIPVVPTGQQRPRFTSRGKFGRAYKSQSQKDHERGILFCILQHRPDKPVDGPLDVTLDAYYPIPASWPKWKKVAALSGEMRPTVKPDLDNVVKQILDCSNGVLFEDDRQVVGVLARKFYSADPRLELEIKEAIV